METTSRTNAKDFLGSKDPFTGLEYLDRYPKNGADWYWWVNHLMWDSAGEKLSFIFRGSKDWNTGSYQFSTLIIIEVRSRDVWRVPLLRGSHPFFSINYLLNCENAGAFEIRFKKSVLQLPWQKEADGHCSAHPMRRGVYLTDTYPTPTKDLMVFETSSANVVEDKGNVVEAGDVSAGDDRAVKTCVNGMTLDTRQRVSSVKRQGS